MNIWLWGKCRHIPRPWRRRRILYARTDTRTVIDLSSSLWPADRTDGCSYPFDRSIDRSKDRPPEKGGQTRWACNYKYSTSSSSFLSALLDPVSDLRKSMSVERVKFLLKRRVMLPSIRDRPDSRRAATEEPRLKERDKNTVLGGEGVEFHRTTGKLFQGRDRKWILADRCPSVSPSRFHNTSIARVSSER